MFLYGHDNYPGSDRNLTDDKNKCIGIVKFEGEARFPKKILVWIAKMVLFPEI
jgi:hypothetical protein